MIFFYVFAFFIHFYFFHPTKAAWLSPQGLAVRDLAFMPIVAFVSQPSAYDILTPAQKNNKHFTGEISHSWSLHSVLVAVCFLFF